MNNNLDTILALKRIAYNNVKKFSQEKQEISDFEIYVCRWWRKKYNIPDTDKRFLNKELDDIIIEYFEDQFFEDPKLVSAYESGFNSSDEMEEERLKEIMGDDYTEEISYMVGPKDENSNENQIEEEETLMDFSSI